VSSHSRYTGATRKGSVMVHCERMNGQREGEHADDSVSFGEPVASLSNCKPRGAFTSHAAQHPSLVMWLFTTKNDHVVFVE
jgi:hypothetical protein